MVVLVLVLVDSHHVIPYKEEVGNFVNPTFELTLNQAPAKKQNSSVLSKNQCTLLSIVHRHQKSPLWRCAP
jgi:hypothetical protein